MMTEATTVRRNEVVKISVLDAPISSGARSAGAEGRNFMFMTKKGSKPVATEINIAQYDSSLYSDPPSPQHV